VNGAVEPAATIGLVAGAYIGQLRAGGVLGRGEDILKCFPFGEEVGDLLVDLRNALS
jgi:hypothetical protein